MKVLAVMNEKGGVGKTNVVAHAGWYFEERGRARGGGRALVVDLDQQANLSSTLAAHLSPDVESVDLFAEPTAVPPGDGFLTVTRSTRALLGVEAVAAAAVAAGDPSPIVTFRDSLAATAAAKTFDVCVIDTPPSLTNRTFGALLAADAVLAPVGVNEYSMAGVKELLAAIKGVSEFYGRPRPLFLGLLPSLYDRKSRRERELYEDLVRNVGKIVFPGMVAKRDAYARAASERVPVWEMKGAPAREAADEIRGVLATVAEKMGLPR